jgi:hypothetical protein
MDNRLIWMPDTSAVNELADDPESDVIMAGLRSGYFVRFPFTVVSEIIANTSGERRRKLLGLCRKLLSEGDCIEPHHEILRIMVAEFESSRPLGLAHVNLRMVEAENEVLRAEDFDESLATQEREEYRTHDRVFTGVYSDAKSAFDKLAARGESMPRSVQELVSRLQSGGVFWTLAKNLYNRVSSKPADDETIRRFYAECEPFRALMVAIFAAQYDRCIRRSGQSLKAGRNDTFMAACLPYTDQFVSHDPGQLACYREVNSIAGLNVAVRSYEEFRRGFSIPAILAS